MNTPAADRRMEILNRIGDCVCRDRLKSYGDAEDNFADIATVWNILLRRKLGPGCQLGPLDVAACMIGTKLARMAETPENLDHWVDAGGYSACGGGIILKNGNNGNNGH